jgi:predicted RNA-binding Zn ribbon-like protein
MAKKSAGSMPKKPRRALAVVRVPAESVDDERVLGFVNTLSARPTATPVERLLSYDALVHWAQEQRVISAPAAERLLSQARRHPHQAALALTRARELREALHALMASFDAGREPAPSVLETISAFVASAYAHGRLVPHDGALQWVSSADDEVDRVGWEIARAAGRLVVSHRLGRVRPCAAGDCGWWFVDDTKNRSRRWCDMKICGNREKIRRFRKRQGA